MSDLRTYLSDTAQRELDSLRAALEARLVALETALANPDRHESIEALIMDLARAATEEAHTASARKWLEAQLAASEKTAAHGPAAAGEGIQGALMQEAASLRRELEQLRPALDRERERADSLQRDADAATSALHEERMSGAKLDTELTQARSAHVDVAAEADALRAANADLTKGVETLRGEMDQARRSVADAQRELGTVRRELEAALAAARSGAADADATRTSAAQLSADLERARAEGEHEAERAREALRERDQAIADLTRLKEGHAAELEAAKAAAANAAAGLEQRLAELSSESDALRAGKQDLERSLAVEREQARAGDRRAQDADARAREAAERGDQAQKRAEEAQGSVQAAERRAADADARARAAEERATALTADVSTEGERLRAAQADLSAAAETVERLRGAEARLVAEIERSQKAGKDLVAEAADLQKRIRFADARIKELELQLFGRDHPAPDTDVELGAMLEDPTPSGEKPIRRFSRYAFRSKIDVKIDLDAAQLVDLSVGGAQVLSAAAFDVHREASVALISDEVPVACRGKIVWSRADPHSKGKMLRYRAGILFTDADPAAVEAFIIRYSST